MLENISYPLQLSSLNAELHVHSLRERARNAIPLRAAAEAGDVARVSQVLRQVGTASDGAKVALRVAVAAGQAAVVRHLLTAGVPLENAKDSTGESAPYVVEAALANSPETLRTLEECGLPLTQVGHVAVLERGRGARASLVTSPMGAAAWGLKTAALEELVSYPELDTDVKAEVKAIGSGGSARLQDFSWAMGATPLILAVQAAGRGSYKGSDPEEVAAKAVQLLLTHNANPEVLSAAGESALHAAGRSGLPKVVKALLDGNANPLLRNTQGDTAYAVAQRAGRPECAELLSKASSASPEGSGPTPGEPGATVELLDEEEAEQAKLSRAREKRREKKSRQREKRATTPPEEAKIPEKATKVPTTPEISGEALQKKLTELRREKTRAAQKVKHLTRRVEEETVKEQQGASQLEELRYRSEELKKMFHKKKVETERAEAAAKTAEEKANALMRQSAAIQDEVAQQRHDLQLEAATLREQLETLQKKRNSVSRSSFASCRHKRIAAEHRRKELSHELMAIASSLQAPEGLKPVPPLFQPTGAPEVRNATLFRELYKQKQMHLAAMRELVAATSQQIHEREAELDEEFDILLGSGLQKFLAALKQEGIIRQYPELKEDPDRAARLRASLLK